LKDRLKLLTGQHHALLYSTGRAAMTALLISMSEVTVDKNRKFVVIPSYTCYSVPASVIKAGLNVMVCDIDPDTLDYDRTQLESLDWSTVLAIVSSNLYGIPNNLDYLERIAHSNGAFMIDDAAQCLGATASGRAVGSFGDAGILSFDKGKVVTSINGGVIVTSSSLLLDRLRTDYSAIHDRSGKTRLVEFSKLILYAILINPSLYWIPERLPFLKLGQTVYDDTFPIERYIDRLAPVVVAQLNRLSALNSDRKGLAARYSSGIVEEGALRHIRLSEAANPVYLRYPVRITDAAARLRFLTTYRQLGCRASYPSCIVDIPEIQGNITVHNNSCEAGRTVADQLVTLPTHQFMTDRDVRNICHGLAELQRDQGTPKQVSIV
jgi:dTDP-4-amino-4,6-dideoxygalactose transaminase